MNMHRVVGAALVASGLLFAGAQPAQAQDRSRVGFFGGLEFAHITEDEGLLGTGPGVRGGLTIRLSPSTMVEFEIGAERHIRNFVFYGSPTVPTFAPVPYEVRWSGTAGFGVARLTHAFGRRAVRPIAWGGAGVMHQAGTRHEITDDGGLPFPDAERRSVSPAVTAFVLDGGGGVDVAVGREWRVRPYAGMRLAFTGGYGPRYILRTGADIGWRW